MKLHDWSDKDARLTELNKEHGSTKGCEAAAAEFGISLGTIKAHWYKLKKKQGKESASKKVGKKTAKKKIAPKKKTVAKKKAAPKKKVTSKKEATSKKTINNKLRFNVLGDDPLLIETLYENNRSAVLRIGDTVVTVEK